MKNQIMEARKFQFSFDERGVEDSLRVVWELRNVSRQLFLEGSQPYTASLKSPDYSFKFANDEALICWISVDRKGLTSGSFEDVIDIQSHIHLLNKDSSAQSSAVSNVVKEGCCSDSSGPSGIFHSNGSNHPQPPPSQARNVGPKSNIINLTGRYSRSNQHVNQIRSPLLVAPAIGATPKVVDCPFLLYKFPSPPTTVATGAGRDLKIGVRAVLSNWKMSLLDYKETLCCSLPMADPVKLMRMPTASFLKFDSKELENSVLRITYDIEIWGPRVSSTVMDDPKASPTDAGAITANGTDILKSMTGMERLLKLPRNVMSDIVLVCEGKEFPAHKLILSCVNHRLLELLGPITNEADNNETKPALTQAQTKQVPAVPVPKTAGPIKQLVSGANEPAKKRIKTCDKIIVKGPTAATLENLLDFIYTGKINKSSDDALVKLLDAAAMYELGDLKQAIFQAMELKMSTENATIFAVAVNKHDAADVVKQAIFGFCKRNLAKLKNKNAEFKDLFWKTPELLA